MTKQLKDDSGAVIPLLGFNAARGLQVPFTSAASNTSASLLSATKVITITSTATCFIELGNNSISANKTNSHYIVSSMPYDIAVGGESPSEERYIAVIGSTASGTLYISERE
jgi:hypothetical protein